MAICWQDVVIMGLKTLFDDPLRWLAGVCALIYFIIIIVTLILLVGSSLGLNIGNMNIWITAFATEVSFITGVLIGRNVRELLICNLEHRKIG